MTTVRDHGPADVQAGSEPGRPPRRLDRLHPIGGVTRSGDARVAVLTVLLLLALGAVIYASLAYGSSHLELSQVWAALRGDGTDAQAAIVLGLRVPRTVVGLVCGVALGVAGALCQAHTRNPLADPGLLGVNAGASLGVVISMAYLGVTAPAGYVWIAVFGAVVAGAVVLGLAARIRVLEPMTTVILAGTVLTALLGSATTAIVLFNPTTMKSFQFWSVGSLAGRDFAVVAGVAPVLALGLIAALANLPALPGLELGEQLAASLGRNTALDRIVGLGAVVLLAGAATAACGALGFLGLLAPHAARRLVGGRPIATVLVSALTGAVVLLVADIAGRLVLTTSEVSVGIMLAIIGAPLFIVLARRLGGTAGSLR
ncbi:iron complex transport system permease protein [Kineosphaera limosa]|uniref:Putative iron-siderophore ABC transporter permease protein n=1 Tax=Kineosphaera limosa NBRC 100340 TaxID=1184609 RepID=K6VFH3_9MICO|nr:iron ABC transporter permease [Kineosphaera limosa]NYE00867.1 iron complex transport system permease protein [Kineosphaera limosa]GAB94938.1 putative iron-siderophore ABC transporter permease protein [Kineosphaera limosa NBRC 100340]